MTDSIIKFPDFAPDARARWEKIPDWAQTKILDAVWCGNCRKSVPIELAQGRMKRDSLILKGTCRHCGKEIVRSIEPEGWTSVERLGRCEQVLCHSSFIALRAQNDRSPKLSIVNH
jgi:ribosomal protein S26